MHFSKISVQGTPSLCKICELEFSPILSEEEKAKELSSPSKPGKFLLGPEKVKPEGPSPDLILRLYLPGWRLNGSGSMGRSSHFFLMQPIILCCKDRAAAHRDPAHLLTFYPTKYP